MPRIRVLVENSSSSDRLKPRAGLSLAIDTGASRLMLDAGPDSSFAGNAAEMGYDLRSVQTLALSHSHIDHTGGLDAFCDINGAAEVVLFDSIESEYFTKVAGPLKFPIGIKCRPSSGRRVRSLVENRQIDERTWFIRNTCETHKKPTLNKTLYAKVGGSYRLDDFRHEGILVIDDGELVVLDSCSHNGIANIVSSVKSAFPGRRIRSYIGGLHCSNPLTGAHEADKELDAIADFCEAEGLALYTGHCTGEYCLRYLEKRIGKNFTRIRTGSDFEA
jgi:Metal-dependent hydrolases of the beta-lactamase superfamily II